MHGDGKSDSSVVPVKPPNKAIAAAIGAEVVEERELAKGNTDDPTRPGHSAGPGVSNGLDRVREAARQDKDARFSALLHHVDFDRLWNGHRRKLRATWIVGRCGERCASRYQRRFRRIGGWRSD